MKIVVEIFNPYLKWRKKTIELEENSTILRLLTLLHTRYDIPKQRYDEHFRERVNFFWGHVIFKNGRVIGSFDKQGFRTTSDDEILEQGDNIVISFAPGGG